MRGHSLTGGGRPSKLRRSHVRQFEVAAGARSSPRKVLCKPGGLWRTGCRSADRFRGRPFEPSTSVHPRQPQPRRIAPVKAAVPRDLAIPVRGPAGRNGLSASRRRRSRSRTEHREKSRTAPRPMECPRSPNRRLRRLRRSPTSTGWTSRTGARAIHPTPTATSARPTTSRRSTPRSGSTTRRAAPASRHSPSTRS